MFLIFIIIVFYYAIKEKLNNKNKTLTYKNENTWIQNLNKSFNKYLGWKTNITFNAKNYGNKILLMSTHKSLVDFVHISFLTSKLFPDHRKVYIMKDFMTKVPIIKKYVKENSIVVTSNKKSTEMQFNILDNINTNDKIIIIIFPEGGIYNDDNREKSDNFCEKNGIKKFFNVLSPRTKGIWTILNKMNIDTILQTKITYEDDLFDMKGKLYKDFLFWNIPSICNLEVDNVTNNFKDNITMDYNKFDQKFFDYWRKI